MAKASVTRLKTPPRPADPQAAAELAHAKAINNLASAIRDHTKAARPAYDTVAGFGERLDGLCTWLKKKGPVLLGLIGTALTAMNVISPNLAHVLGEFATRLFGAT